MPLLTVSNVSKLYGPDQVLDSVSFKLERGEHVALVGSNGSGKSTLLRIIAGAESHDSGQVSRSHNAIVTYVSQHAQFESTHTLWEAMLEVFADAIAAHANMRTLEQDLVSNPGSEAIEHEYMRQSDVAEHAGYDYESRIERVLTGLELDRSKWSQPVSRLSGGQKTRANLARALLKDSDLLLLDEPTNHLDIAAIEWLEKYLQTQRRAYIIVAHDRYFLDSISSRTLELSFAKLQDYPASYAGYLKLREERRSQAVQTYERQQETIAATEDFVRRFGAGQRSKEAKGRQKRLDRLERVERPEDESRLQLRMDRTRRKGDTILRLDRLAVGYGTHVIVQGPDELVVAHGARVAIVGPNGAGKTTLARSLIGQLHPLRGHFSWAPGSTPAYYAQTTSAVFSPGQTVLQAFIDRFTIGEEAARNYLGGFLFRGDEVLKMVDDLSGGEQGRLALATLLYSHPNVMLLDEPTNHLDIAAREALEKALHNFGGSLILISHDRFLIDELATEIWVIDGGRIEVFDGSWTDYQAGRYRRSLNYTDPSKVGPATTALSAPEASPPAKGSRPRSAIVATLTQSQSGLVAVLRRGETSAATASVDEITKTLDSFDTVGAEIRALTEDLIESRG